MSAHTPSNLIAEAIREVTKRREEELQHLFINHLGFMPPLLEIKLFCTCKEYRDDRRDYYWGDDFIGSVCIKTPEFKTEYMQELDTRTLEIRDRTYGNG